MINPNPSIYEIYYRHSFSPPKAQSSQVIPTLTSSVSSSEVKGFGKGTKIAAAIAAISALCGVGYYWLKNRKLASIQQMPPNLNRVI